MKKDSSELGDVGAVTEGLSESKMFKKLENSRKLRNPLNMPVRRTWAVCKQTLLNLAFLA